MDQQQRQVEEDQQSQQQQQQSQQHQQASTSATTSPTELRRSQREHKRPRFDDEMMVQLGGDEDGDLVLGGGGGGSTAASQQQEQKQSPIPLEPQQQQQPAATAAAAATVATMVRKTPREARIASKDQRSREMAAARDAEMDAALMTASGGAASTGASTEIKTIEEKTIAGLGMMATPSSSIPETKDETTASGGVGGVIAAAGTGGGGSGGGQSTSAQFTARDDVALMTGVTHCCDLSAVHASIAFSQPFTLADLERRWHDLLYSEPVAAHARRRFQDLPPHEVLRIQAATVFTEAEQQLLAQVKSAEPGGTTPSLPTFRQLLVSQQPVFHYARTPQVLMDRWNELRACELLLEQRDKLTGHPPSDPTADLALLPPHRKSFKSAAHAPQKITVMNDVAIWTRQCQAALDALRESARVPSGGGEQRGSVHVSAVTGLLDDERLRPGEVAVLLGRRSRFAIRHPPSGQQQQGTVIGRPTAEVPVHVDVTQEGPAAGVSRRQALIVYQPQTKIFTLANVGRGQVWQEGRWLAYGERSQLKSHELIEIGRLRFLFISSPGRMDYHHAPSSSSFYVDYGGRNESDREEMTMQQNGGPIAAKKKDVYVRGRDAQIDNVMKGWQKEFCEWRQAKVLVTTFNVNGRTAPRRIAGWLDGADRADLVVVGLQEMDLSVGTYIMDTGRKEEEWTDCIRASMQSDGGKDDFFLVRGTRLVGIYLTLWRRRASKVPVADVVVAQRPTGLSLGGFSRLGNKGGVAVSCRLFDTTVCFVNAHMAAGDGELMRRNQDFGEIASLTFDEPAPPTLYRHDAVIWLGDLNYRLDGIGYSTDVRQIASGGNFTDLLNHDQLVEQRRLDAAFSRFHEAPITFRPTYKYDCGTSNWDSSEKARTPAWTDRVMWLETGTASEKVVAECEQYTSRDVVVVSDHKPVVARFALRLLQVDTDKANRLYERALRELDRHANELLPQIDISPVELTVATIRYGEPALRTVRIANTGRTIANVKLDCERGGGRNGGGGWLRVEPTYCSLEPGETTQIAFYMSADEQRMPEDGALEKNLQAIVVVQLQNERSYFVVVQAKFFSPVFGQSLRALLDPTRPKGGEPGGRAKIEEKNLIDFSDEDDTTGRNKKEATAVKDDYDIEGRLNPLSPPPLIRFND